MKALKIILISFIVVIVLMGTGLFVFIKTFDLNRFRSRIAEELSSRVGRGIVMERLDFTVSLTDGVILNIYGASINDHPDFSPDPFLKVDRLALNLNVIAFLKRREIVVSDIRVDAPQIRVIRNTQGILNLSTLAQAKKPSVSAPAGSGEEQSASPSPQLSTRGPSLPQLLVQSFGIEKGQCLFIDRRRDPAWQVALTDIDFQVHDFSLAQPFDFQIRCRLFSDKENLQVEGKAQLDVVHRQFRVDDVVMDSDLALLSRESLTRAIPPAGDFFAPEGLKGKLTLMLGQMIAGPRGIPVLSLSGTLSNAGITLKALPFPLENVACRFNLSETDFEIPEFSVDVADGRVTAKGRLMDYPQDRKYHVEFDAKDLSLQQGLEGAGSSVDLRGRLGLMARLSGQGFGSKDFIETLSGDGYLFVEDGQLKDFNVLRMIFKKMAMLPNLVEIFEANLPEEYRKHLESADTDFQKVASDFRVGEGVITIDKAEVTADTFSLDARGQVDWRQHLVLLATVFVPQDLTSSMVATVPELQALVGGDGLLKIPLKKYDGLLSQVRVEPDLEYVGKRVIVSKGKEEIKRLIQKALGGDDESSTEEDDADGAPLSPEEQRRPEEMIIENILDSILKTD